MRRRSRFLLRFVTGLLLLARIACADEAASTNGIRFTFIEPPIVPAQDLPREARRAGYTADPDTKMKNHGALSNIVAGHIAAIAVTWADANRFKTHEQTETIVSRLLSAPTGAYRTGSYCSTYTSVIWAQLLVQPNIAARVEHTDGKPGQLLLFASGDAYLFAYKDREAKWWFGSWSEGVQK